MKRKWLPLWAGKVVVSCHADCDRAPGGGDCSRMRSSRAWGSHQGGRPAGSMRGRGAAGAVSGGAECREVGLLLVWAGAACLHVPMLGALLSACRAPVMQV